MTQNNKFRNVCITIILIAIALLSATKITDITTDSESVINKKNITSYDDRIKATLLLSSGAVIASTAISVLSGDTGTPLAENLADISKYSLIILSALFLEKYFAVQSGFIIFRILVPIIILLFIIALWTNQKHYRDMAIKLICTSIIIGSIVPVTVSLSDITLAAYQTSIDEAKENELVSEQNIEDNTDEDKSFMSSLVNSAEDKLKAAAQYCIKIGEALSILFVVSCLIPVIVLIVAFILLKLLFNQLSFSGLKKLIKKSDNSNRKTSFPQLPAQ